MMPLCPLIFQLKLNWRVFWRVYGYRKIFYLKLFYKFLKTLKETKFSYSPSDQFKIPHPRSIKFSLKCTIIEKLCKNYCPFVFIMSFTLFCMSIFVNFWMRKKSNYFLDNEQNHFLWKIFSIQSASEKKGF